MIDSGEYLLCGVLLSKVETLAGCRARPVPLGFGEQGDDQTFGATWTCLTERGHLGGNGRALAVGNPLQAGSVAERISKVEGAGRGGHIKVCPRGTQGVLSGPSIAVHVWLSFGLVGPARWMAERFGSSSVVVSLPVWDGI